DLLRHGGEPRRSEREAQHQQPRRRLGVFQAAGTDQRQRDRRASRRYELSGSRREKTRAVLSPPLTLAPGRVDELARRKRLEFARGVTPASTRREPVYAASQGRPASP